MATSKPPSKIRDKTALLNAGLGEASIQFFLDMSRLECHDKILERFPKLKETGYEILLFQRGDDSGFVNIGGPQTARWLKDAAGSAKIYLCPLQKDVDMGLIDSDDEPQDENNIREVECIECGTLVPMSYLTPCRQELKKHISDKHGVEINPVKRQHTLDWSSLQSDSNDKEHVDIKECDENLPVPVFIQKISLLEEMCPNAITEEINAALSRASGDVNAAAESLLGVEDDEDVEIVESSPTSSEISDPKAAIAKFRSELESSPNDKTLPEDLKSQLEPYLLDAGLDPHNQDRKFLVQGLMLYNVINKRCLEIEDICK
ncbi:Hypothetical predicted protein, partial [Paramuricea clavata]